MISILICGINSEYRKQITANLKATIEMPYELLYYDNNINPLSISAAYNHLKNQANGDYLCFIHEDIEFKSIGWGLTISNIFKTIPETGLLGVAGAKYKSHIPGSWTSIGHKFLVCHYEQYHKDGRLPEQVDINSGNELTDVVFVDGFFLCITKEIGNLISFDEAILKGFHGYDFDLAMSVLNLKKKVIITNGINIAHHSDGTINKEWFYTHKQLCLKWKNDLPTFSSKVSFIEKVAIDYSSFLKSWKYLGQLKLTKERVSFFFSYFNFHFLWFFLYKKLKF